MEHRPRAERPDTLRGITQRIETPSGKMYVNINLDEDGDPFEVFVTIGSSGGFTNAMTEALSKSLSNSLRSGTDPEVLADDLVGIRGPGTPMVDNGDDVFSIPDGVGIAMMRVIHDRLRKPVRGMAAEEEKDASA